MSNVINVCAFLFGVSLNHLMTSCENFQWLDFLFSLAFFTMFSRSCLLNFPISGLHGLISRHVGLFMKFSLWSLRVTKESLSAVVLILNNAKEQYTPPASQQQQRKYSANQQLSRLKKEPKRASKLLSHDNDGI